MQKKIVLAMASIFGLSACFDGQGTQNKEEELAAVKMGIAMGDEHEGLFYNESNKIFKEAAQNHPKLEVIYQNADHSFDKQKQQVEAMIQQGTQALIIHPVSQKPEDLRSLVNTVCRSGIPAVYFNRDPGGNLISGCSTAYFVGIDEMQTGIMQGLQVLRGYSQNLEWDKNQDDTVQYAVLLAKDDIVSTKQRLMRLSQTLQHYPDLGRPVELITELELPLEHAQAEADLQRWIAQPDFSKVEVVVAGTDTSAIQLHEALRQQGHPLPIFAMGGENEAKRLMNQGRGFHTMDAMLEESSRTALNLALNLARGERADKDLHHSIENRYVLIAPLDLEEAQKRKERQKSKAAANNQHQH